MPNYIIAYHGGNKPASPEEGAKHMEKWKTWLADLADAVVNPGTPLTDTQIVSTTGVSIDAGENSMSGFSVVTANTMDEAIVMAKSCPFLDLGGTLEVAKMMDMP